MIEVGLFGVFLNGFNENFVLFQIGKCGMWMDVMVVVSFVFNFEELMVVDKVGYVLVLQGEKFVMWLWVWMFVIFFSSDQLEVVKKFVVWVILKVYIEEVVKVEGWVNVLLGICILFYENLEYQQVVFFVKFMLDSIMFVDLKNLIMVQVFYIGM